MIFENVQTVPWTGEIAQWVKVLSAKPADLGPSS